MATQERAIRTRRRIIDAAAQVFDREGYQAATITEILKQAGVTKGALYFHFQSKEEVAQAVLEEQRPEEAVRPQEVRLQELVDMGLVLSYRLRQEPLVRASVRLTLDPYARGVDRRAPFHSWTAYNLAVLEAAEAHGELLPHVVPSATAELCVATFAGLQLMSQTLSGYEDLPDRLSVFQHHLMPSIATPHALARLDLSPGRGRQLVATAGGFGPVAGAAVAAAPATG